MNILSLSCLTLTAGAIAGIVSIIFLALGGPIAGGCFAFVAEATACAFVISEHRAARTFHHWGV